MPCIIYRVSYENELRGKFGPLLGAFAGFSSASKGFKKKKKKMKAGRTNPCQQGRLLKAKGEDEEERGRMGQAESLTFYSRLCFVGWFSL